MPIEKHNLSYNPEIREGKYLASLESKTLKTISQLAINFSN